MDTAEDARVLLGKVANYVSVMGAIAVQARNIIKGKDPQDMRDPKFCAQAFAQGGAAGICRDFLFADANRFAQGPVETARGLVAGLIDDSTRLTLGNLQQMLRGQETRFGKEAVNFAKRYTPGSNTWYAVGIRLFWDRLQEAADPQAHVMAADHAGFQAEL